MMECPRSRELAGKLATGEIAPDERESLRKHIQECEDCRSLVETHRELLEAAATLDDPSPAEFRVMRMQVQSRLPRGGTHSSWRTFVRDAWAFLRLQPAGAFLILVALLTAGGLAGAGLASRPGDGGSLLSEQALLRAVRRQASTAIGVAESWDEPLAYGNVVVRPAGGDKLALSFDVSRHVSLVASRDSDLAKDVLAHAILEPSPLGQRLKAISVGREIIDPRLRDALILALRGDPDLAVRLRALEVLSQYPFDGTVQGAVLETLRQDPSVQLRLQALELLAARQVAPDLLRRTIDQGGLASDEAVLVRAIELQPGR